MIILKGFLCFLNFRYGDFELAGDRADENVVQKYHRLKCELQELSDEIEKIKVSQVKNFNIVKSKIKNLSVYSSFLASTSHQYNYFTAKNVKHTVKIDNVKKVKNYKIICESEINL